MSISELAIVSKKAKIASDVEIGPFSIVEDDVEIGPGVKIWPNVHIYNGSRIGDGTQIHMGSVIGDLPQDLAFKNKPTFVKIGKRNVIREHVTIHRGTEDGTSTILGDDCYLMVNSHLGHNCDVSNNVIIANGALLAGYVSVGKGAFISGNVVIHQFCRIGELAMIGGFSGINKDVPPYMLVRGPSVVRTLNLVGLRRSKIARDSIESLRKAFKILYLSEFNTKQALEEIGKLPQTAELSKLIEFVQTSKRGICKSKETDEEYFG